METQIIVALIAFAAGVCVAAVTGGLSRRLKISEFRQAWINDLRNDVADYLGRTQKWFYAYGKQEEDWKLFNMGNEASVILYRIQMRINPNENEYKKDDDAFLAALLTLRSPGAVPPLAADTHWAEVSVEVISKARRLLKREWEITKRMKNAVIR